ncbi:hypothetical protein AQUCO_00100475v1 [Aquilegia coerulea]|uniref:F-box domain-containing protein n=1 Tax=Aquilegia coerulea TaxID=218851 RepID=A0A2G5FAJ8_AQUCA|nr:hypothetical protein AQUCO_00100475v1 [Aquilegia coerulea]
MEDAWVFRPHVGLDLLGNLSDLIPNDVVVDILIRLPGESLLRFQCVCKDWYLLIQHPIFLRMRSAQVQTCSKYVTEREKRLREYRQNIKSSYQPLHKDLYAMQPTTIFVPSFFKAITENTEESLRDIISEPSPGVYIFEMLQPRFL